MSQTDSQGLGESFMCATDAVRELSIAMQHVGCAASLAVSSVKELAVAIGEVDRFYEFIYEISHTERERRRKEFKRKVIHLIVFIATAFIVYMVGVK